MMAACGASETRPPVSAPPPSASAAVLPAATASSVASATAPPVEPPKEEAHRLVVATIACWLGGVWTDAEGDLDDATRAADAERLCHDVVKRIYGTDDPGRFERLRAVEAGEVITARDKILAVARADSVDAARQEQLGKFFDAVADAERETMMARRAGDRVKKDIAGEREAAKLRPDEAAAVGPLSETKAFDALLTIDVGGLTPEARAVAVLCAMDRMQTARGLTKHLKVYVVERPFSVYFGVAAPDVPRDTKKPLKGGAWLAYLTSVAQAAGHPVPEAAKSLTDRELLAWGGTLDGLADQLRALIGQLSDATDLERVSRAIVERVDIGYRASETAVQRQPEPAGPPRSLRPPKS